jgi:hypothetical protein
MAALYLCGNATEISRVQVARVSDHSWDGEEVAAAANNQPLLGRVKGKAYCRGSSSNSFLQSSNPSDIV